MVRAKMMIKAVFPKAVFLVISLQVILVKLIDHPASASYSTVSPTIFFSSTSLQPPSPLALLLIIAPPPKALFQTHHSNLHLSYSSLLQKFFDLTETANPLSAPLVF